MIGRAGHCPTRRKLYEPLSYQVKSPVLWVLQVTRSFSPGERLMYILRVATESLTNGDELYLLADTGSLAAAPGGSRGAVRRREQV
jgi:hypothetical protein